jgi:hypothetical protein
MLGAHCRAVFQKQYTEEAWVEAIEGVYADVLTGAIRSGSGS